MKYITITSKRTTTASRCSTQISDCGIVDRTPYKKDVLKALAEVPETGIKLFFYYRG